MEDFPENFKRDNCFNQLTSNQEKMLKEVRKTFYDTIMKSIDNCDSHVKLDFPDKMWAENKTKLVGELLERFGQMKIVTSSTEHGVTKLIQIGKDIPKNVTRLIIEFNKD